MLTGGSGLAGIDVSDDDDVDVSSLVLTEKSQSGWHAKSGRWTTTYPMVKVDL